MGISERRDRDKREMRQLILDAALQLFLEEGFDQVSMRRIADRIEFSPATMYLYFKDKDDILFELHHQAFERFYQAEMAAMSFTDPLDRLRALGRIYVEFGLDHPEEYQLMFIMTAPGMRIKETHDWKDGMKTYDVLRSIVADCLKAGRIRHGDPEEISLALWSLVHGMVSLRIRHRLSLIPEEGIRPFMLQSLSGVLDSMAV